MPFEKLHSLVDPALAAELGTLWARYVDQGGVDLDGFLAWLKERGVIDESTFLLLHARTQQVQTGLSTLSGTTFPEDLEDWVPDFEEPRVRGPRYQSLGKLAEGAMGEVHVARDHELQRKVAVKQIHPDLAARPVLVARFIHEAQITAQLDHPNIVPVYSLDGEEGAGALAYAMKLVEGRTFAQRIGDVNLLRHAGRSIPPDLQLDARVEQLIKACEAVAYAHSRGVVHRDLKPENIMVGAFGEVYVMDWGIARIMGPAAEILDDLVELSYAHKPVHQTRFGTILGTPAYMSPEQAKGQNELLDGRSDLFSLGVILFELTYLKPALTGVDTDAILVKVQQGQFESFAHTHGDPVDPGLQAIIRRATALDREDRYPDVTAFAEDLRRWLRGEELEAMPDRWPQRMGRWMEAHAVLVLVGMLLFGGLTSAVAIGSLWNTVQTWRSAEVRETQLSTVQAVVGRRGHKVDNALQELEGLVKVLAESSRSALLTADPPPAPPGVAAEPWFAPVTLPSERYQRDVSLDWPVIKLAEGESSNLETVDRLAGLGPTLRRVMLKSQSEDAAALPQGLAERLLTETGAPITWLYIATESGVSAAFPGHTGLPPGYDLRRRPWYGLTRDERGPKWGQPYVDVSGLGLMMPMSMGLYDDAGDFIGAVGVEIAFDYLIEHLMEIPELAGASEAYLLDRDGRILVSSEDLGRTVAVTALGTRRLRLRRYPDKALIDLTQQRSSGWLETYDEASGDSMLTVFQRMDAVGWTYVVHGRTRDLLLAR